MLSSRAAANWRLARFSNHVGYLLLVPVKTDPAAHPPTRILFFDDDADILELCSIILRSRGYEVFTRNCCDSVVECVADVQPDIIFMDGRIPEIGGVEATRQIKANRNLCGIPVVFFSANADVNYLSTQAGADAYLPKPFDISELETVIHRTLNGRSASAQLEQATASLPQTATNGFQCTSRPL